MVYRQTSDDDLGATRAVHTKSATLGGRIFLNALLLGPAAWFAIRAWGSGLSLIDPATPALVTASYAVLFVVLPLAGIVSTIQAVRTRRDRVDVRERGLVATVRGTEQRIPFREIRAVTSRVVRTRGGVVHDHRVRWTGGELRIDHSFGDVERLLSAIREATLERLVEDARDELAAGRSVRFGPWTLHPDALEVRGARLPRDLLGSVDLSAGVLRVRGKGHTESWAEQDVADVPNVHVLLAVLADRAT